MQTVKRKSEDVNPVIQELSRKPIFVKDFVRTYTTPPVIRLINRMINRGELQVYATIYGRREVIHNLEASAINVKNGKLYVDIRVPEESVKDEVDNLRMNGRRTYILTNYEKLIRVYLDEYDILTFNTEEELEEWLS